MSIGPAPIDPIIFIYNLCGRPSLFSSILIPSVIYLFKANRKRNKFIDELMATTPIDKTEFDSTIQSIKELFESKIDGVNQKIDVLLALLQKFEQK